MANNHAPSHKSGGGDPLLISDLGDYAATTWTPVLTASTPGDLSVAYTRQLGTYTQLGRIIIATFSVVTSTFTYTTASGAINITGLPFTSATMTGYQWTGPVNFSGFTNANYTQMTCNVASAATALSFVGAASAKANATLNITDFPSGGSVVLRGQIIYETS